MNNSEDVISSLELSPIPVIITELEDDRILYANSEALTQLMLIDVQSKQQFLSALFKFEVDYLRLREQVYKTKNKRVTFEAPLWGGGSSIVMGKLHCSRIIFNDKKAAIYHILDQTLVKHNAQELEDTQKFFQSLLQASPDAICMASAKMEMLYLSPCGLEMFGYQSQQEIVGAHVLDFIDPTFHEITTERYELAVKSQNVGLLEYLARRKDGSTFYVEFNIAQLFESDGSVTGLFIVGRDIDDRKQTEAALQEAYARLQVQAIRDPLTGLFNRRYMEETLERELARCQREDIPLTVVMMDIDFFKHINDTYGHKGGDRVLVALSNLLIAKTRSEDVVCRFGGEEFIAILPGASLGNAMERAENWRREFEALEVDHDDIKIKSTLSSGVATFTQHGIDSDTLLRVADKALYEAKSLGRNRVVYTSKLD